MGQSWTHLCMLYDQSRPPASKFSVDQIPDLSGKVMIVTGGNSGVGKETVKALLNKNAKVYMASRNKSNAEKAIADLKQQTGKEAIFLELDLASLKSVRKAAEEYMSKETKLHVLFNNGGVMVPPIEELTADGVDLQFGTNCLGPSYFTKLLLPVLLDTAKDGPKARVITTSSSTHMFCDIDFDTLVDGPKRIAKGTNDLYSQSKYGNIVFARELARRYGDKGVVSIAVNPGNLATGLQRHTSPMQHWFIDAVFSFPAPMGALTQLWGGTMPETEAFNGQYLIPWARLGNPRADTANPETGERLWNWLEEQAKKV